MKKKKKIQKIFLISIHSFTKKFGESQRGVEIGLFWNKNMNLLIPIQQNFQHENIYYGRNFPIPASILTTLWIGIQGTERLIIFV